MEPEFDLSTLSHAQKDALIRKLLPLVAQLEAALARIAQLEARIAELERSPKTSANSSTPLSKAAKPARPPSKDPNRRPRPGSARSLAEHPDRTVEAHLAACPHCAADFPAARQTPQEVYDRIELPPVKPDVTRVHLFAGRGTCCGQRATATAPAASNPARRSAARSRPWWSTCIMPKPSGSSGCAP